VSQMQLPILLSQINEIDIRVKKENSIAIVSNKEEDKNEAIRNRVPFLNTIRSNLVNFILEI